MANFTPQMLRDLLASPDPKDQELAKQLSALEFSNENARLGNYPAPDAARPPVATTPGAFAPQVPDAPAAPVPVDQSALNNQYVQGNIGPGGSGGMAVQDMPFPQNQPPAPVAPPPPDPRQQELVPNQFRNETTGKITTLSPPPGAPPAGGTPGMGGTPGKSSEYPGYQQPTPQSDAQNGIQVLQSVQRADGKLWQIVKAPSIDSSGRQTMATQFREVTPSAIDPAVMARQKMDLGAANIEHIKAETGHLNETPAQAAEKAFQVEKAKLKAQSGELGGAGDTSGLSGQALMDSIKSSEPGMASIVTELIAGKYPVPTGSAMRNPQIFRAMTLAGRVDDSFDAANYPTRVKTMGDAATGVLAKSNNALNTGIGHMMQLSDAVGGLNNFSNVPLVNTTANYVKNKIIEHSGGTGPTNFEAVVNRVAPEITKIWRGVGGAEQDIKRDLDSLSMSNSPEQLQSAISQIAGLMESKLQSNEAQYKRVIGRAADTATFVTPAARAQLDALASRKGGGAPVAAPAPAAQPAVPAMGTLKGGYIFKGGNPADPSSWMRQ